MSETKRIDKYSFILSNVIGNGAFSKVYKGINDQNKAVVAIKVIEMATIKSQTYVNLLQSEVSVMKELNHQNIVKLEDVYNTPNNIYLVTEFCNGGDVGKILLEKKKISESQVKQILADILKGMRVLVSKRIIHRDLKPQNFFIHNGIYKIGDFGFSKFLGKDEEMIVSTMVGTPLYMSLQCLAKVPYSSKCDIWSLGICLYEMLTGTTPWPSSSHIELMKNIQAVPVNFPLDSSPSSLLKNMILRCLAVNEEYRIGWKELFEHPLLNEATELLPLKSSVKYLSTPAVKNANTKSFVDTRQRLFNDKSNESVNSLLINATTTKKKYELTFDSKPVESKLLAIPHQKATSHENENIIKLINFIKVICQNIQELQETINVSPCVLDKLLFCLVKYLAVTSNRALKEFTVFSDKSYSTVNESIDYFFQTHADLKTTRSQFFQREGDTDFLAIFNNELQNESQKINIMLKRVLSRVIRELNHLCLLKFLKENEDKSNVPHLLIFLSALVDLLEIIRQIENISSTTFKYSDIEIFKFLTKKEATDVAYYKKIRRKIFEMEI